MKIYLASDHTGFEIKDKVKVFLEDKGYEVEDCGALEFDKNDDYPDFIGKAANKVSEDPENRLGIIFGGSGQGEAVAANKFKGIRCALFYSKAVPAQAVDVTGKKSDDPFEILKLTRLHNAANMLSFGVRFLPEEDILHAIDLWIHTPPASDERHVRRIEKIKNLENNV
ncbi:MAG: RpiB/LacA/LacB family sugar-phosphate isomerase [Candidatus Levyibacteriota bacterium]